MSGWLRLHRGLQLRGVALGQRQKEILIEADPHVVLRTLPDPDRGHGLVPRVHLDRIVELKAVIENLLALGRARRLGGGAGHHRDEAPAVALRRGHEAVAGGFVVAGLDAVDVGIGPEQAVAVRLRDVVVAKLALREFSL